MAFPQGREVARTERPNWLKVVVNKVFSPLTWEQLWAGYLHIDSNLQINLTEVKYQWL
jgi:hypothetical protein